MGGVDGSILITPVLPLCILGCRASLGFALSFNTNTQYYAAQGISVRRLNHIPQSVEALSHDFCLSLTPGNTLLKSWTLSSKLNPFTRITGDWKSSVIHIVGGDRSADDYWCSVGCIHCSWVGFQCLTSTFHTSKNTSHVRLKATWLKIFRIIRTNIFFLLLYSPNVFMFSSFYLWGIYGISPASYLIWAVHLIKKTSYFYSPLIDRPMERKIRL